MRSPVLLLITFIWLLAAPVLHCQSANSSTMPALVILDTNIGDDIHDVLAPGFLLQSPEIRLIGITSAWGDTAMRSRLLDRLLRESGHSNIPVATGIVRHHADEATFSQRRWAEREPESEHPPAIDQILRQVSEHPGQVTLLAIGPLTRVAAALNRDPVTMRS